MLTVNAFHAQSCGPVVVKPIKLVLAQPFPDYSGLDWPRLEGVSSQAHQQNAEAAVAVLNHLPQGTLDRVLILLLQQRAGFLVVPPRDELTPWQVLQRAVQEYYRGRAMKDEEDKDFVCASADIEKDFDSLVVVCYDHESRRRLEIQTYPPVQEKKG